MDQLGNVRGQRIKAIDGPGAHDFTFTPAISLWVDCRSTAELERVAGLLADGGTTFMPAGDYGWSELYTWVGDRYGVTWQLNVPRAGSAGPS